MHALTGVLSAVILCLAVTVPGTHAQADPGVRNHRAVAHHSVGHRVRSLPRGHVTLAVNRISYRYHGGTFYRPTGEGFLVVRAPLGARVGHLPAGAIHVSIGPRRYARLNSTWYLWDAPRREYVVVAAPEGGEPALAKASSPEQVFVYPTAGQSEEQRARDRYECWVWAVEQTGHDPSASGEQPGTAGDYHRANAACLEGRGYTVK